MWVATFRLHTASLHQAMRSTGYVKPYKALCFAVPVGCSLSGLLFLQLSCCCDSWSWAAMLLEFQFHYPCWCLKCLWPPLRAAAGGGVRKQFNWERNLKAWIDASLLLNIFSCDSPTTWRTCAFERTFLGESETLSRKLRLTERNLGTT